MEKGKFIVHEGLDGCGKDTQLGLLKKHLEEQGKEVVISSNIDHGPLGMATRKLLEPGNRDFVSSYHLSIVILCNMAITYKQIQKDIDAGKYVLCSRWYLSSLAYGGGKSDKEYRVILDYIRSLNIDPDLVIYLSISPETAMERINNRNGTAERYDDVNKLKNISEKFTHAIACTKVNVAIVDGEQSSENVFSEILKKTKLRNEFCHKW